MTGCILAGMETRQQDLTEKEADVHPSPKSSAASATQWQSVSLSSFYTKLIDIMNKASDFIHSKIFIEHNGAEP